MRPGNLSPGNLGKTVWFVASLFLFGAPLSVASDLKQALEERRLWLMERGLLGALEQPTYVNALITEDSPYLLSHALQPVNWHPYSPTELQRAQTVGQLIYISVGYQTCFWCHVIADESYSDPEFAELLNQSYTAIKIDRERQPEVDNRFRLALERMAGEAGWPIQVVMTPGGDILWIDSYQPKKELSAILSRLATRWRDQPKRTAALARQIHQQLLPETINPSSSATVLDGNSEYQQALADIKRTLEREQTGAGPRFLRPDWLLSLASEAQHAENPEPLIALIKTQLDQLLRSPSYDIVDGGMHRYAVDGDWREPHFEKMLYDQAMLIRALAITYQLTGEHIYLEFALHTAAWVRSALGSEFGYMSSLSARTEEGEGRYYQFDASQLTDAGYDSLEQVSNGEYWLLSNAGLRSPDARYWLPARQLRLQKAKPEQDDKIILAWNALYLRALVELDLVAENQEIHNDMLALANQLKTTFHEKRGDKSDGDWYRISFLGRRSVAATMEDFAQLLLGYSAFNLATGLDTYTDLLPALGEQLASQIDQAELQLWVADTELPASAAEGIQAFYQLSDMGYAGARVWHQRMRQAVAPWTSSKAVEFFAANKALYGNTTAAWSQSRFAGGKGSAQILMTESDSAEVRIKIAPGWHINASETLPNLIPTQLSLLHAVQQPTVTYPPADTKKLSFYGDPIPLFEGALAIDVTNFESDGPQQLAELTLQACSDRLCLPPETLYLAMPRQTTEKQQIGR